MATSYHPVAEALPKRAKPLTIKRRYINSEPAVQHFVDRYAQFNRNEVQATYDWVSAHAVRVQLNANWTSGNDPVWLTPNQARELASLLCFAADDAESLDDARIGPP
jgi:hypothetical protein